MMLMTLWPMLSKVCCKSENYTIYCNCTKWIHMMNLWAQRLKLFIKIWMFRYIFRSFFQCVCITFHRDSGGRSADYQQQVPELWPLDLLARYHQGQQCSYWHPVQWREGLVLEWSSFTNLQIISRVSLSYMNYLNFYLSPSQARATNLVVITAGGQIRTNVRSVSA